MNILVSQSTSLWLEISSCWIMNKTSKYVFANHFTKLGWFPYRTREMYFIWAIAWLLMFWRCIHQPRYQPSLIRPCMAKNMYQYVSFRWGHTCSNQSILPSCSEHCPLIFIAQYTHYGWLVINVKLKKAPHWLTSLNVGWSFLTPLMMATRHSAISGSTCWLITGAL